MWGFKNPLRYGESLLMIGLIVKLQKSFFNDIEWTVSADNGANLVKGFAANRNHRQTFAQARRVLRDGANGNTVARL